MLRSHLPLKDKHKHRNEFVIELSRENNKDVNQKEAKFQDYQ